MNCLDYRRLLAAGEAETAEMKAHRLQCAACAALFRSMPSSSASCAPAWRWRFRPASSSA